MFDSVMAASLMTHRDIRSLSGALAVAHGVRRLARASRAIPACCSGSPPTSCKDEAKIAAHYGDQRPQDRPSRRRSVAGHRPRRVGARTAAVNRHSRRSSTRPIATAPSRSAGAPPWASRRPAFPTCLYLLLTTDSFEEALTEVVNLGGDTDTAGAILGSHGRGLLRRRRDSRALARRPAESRRHRCTGPSRWPSGRAAGFTFPT